MEADTVFRSSSGREELTFGTDFNRQDTPTIADRAFRVASKPRQIAEFENGGNIFPPIPTRISNPYLPAILERFIATYLRAMSEKAMVQYVSPRRGTLAHCPMCAYPIVQDAPEAAYFGLSRSPEIERGITDWLAFPDPVEETLRREMLTEPPNEGAFPPGAVAILVKSDSEVSRPIRQNIADQLGSLQEMRDGWLAGTGRAPTHEGLTKLGDLYAMHFSYALPQPYLYPTPEGGVRAEWTFGSNEVSLNINLETLSGEWHTVDLATREDEENTLDLTVPSSWQWLSERIKALENIPE